MEIKPGYKTTEFWLTCAADVFGMVMASGVIAGDSIVAKAIGIGVMVLATLGYTAARAWTKAASP